MIKSGFESSEIPAEGKESLGEEEKRENKIQEEKTEGEQKLNELEEAEKKTEQQTEQPFTREIPPTVAPKLEERQREIFESTISTAEKVLNEKRREFRIENENWKEIKNAFEEELMEKIGGIAKEFLRENRELQEKFSIDDVESLNEAQAWNYLRGNEEFEKYLRENKDFQKYSYLDATIKAVPDKENLPPDVKLILFEIAQKRGVSDNALINLWENIKLEKFERKSEDEIRGEKLNKISQNIQSNYGLFQKLKNIGLLSEKDFEKVETGEMDYDDLMKLGAIADFFKKLKVSPDQIQKKGIVRLKVKVGERIYKWDEILKMGEEHKRIFRSNFESDLTSAIREEQERVKKELGDFAEGVKKGEILDEIYNDWEKKIFEEGLKKLEKEKLEKFERHVEERGVDVKKAFKEADKVVDSIYEDAQDILKEGGLNEMKKWAEGFREKPPAEIVELLSEHFKVFEGLKREEIMGKLKECPLDPYEYAKKRKTGILEYIFNLIIWAIENNLQKKG